MASVYTIQGARKRKSRKGKRTAHQRRFASASKKCKGKKKGAFNACLRREMKK